MIGKKMRERSMDSPENGSTTPKHRLILGFVVSFMVLSAKHASRVPKKLMSKPKDQFGLRSDSPRFFASPKSPLKSSRPKQLLTTLSNKAIKFVHRKRHDKGEAEEDIGGGGICQRTILMGEKCQPLDFSGAIYYDSKGNQVGELPFRSPRASPMPAYLSSKRALIR